MAVILYRDGEQVRIPPETLSSHLGNGYFLTREESISDESFGEEIPLDDSDDEVRKAAKELGISHWHVINIDKLKVKIEEATNGDST